MPQFSTEEDRLLQSINTRAMTDASFRKHLLKDPRAAIKESIGVQLPDGLRIRFVEKPSDIDTFLVLPESIDPALELSSAELESVAGGAGDGNCGAQGSCLCTNACCITGRPV